MVKAERGEPKVTVYGSVGRKKIVQEWLEENSKYDIVSMAGGVWYVNMKETLRGQGYMVVERRGE